MTIKEKLLKVAIEMLRDDYFVDMSQYSGTALIVGSNALVSFTSKLGNHIYIDDIYFDKRTGKILQCIIRLR